MNQGFLDREKFLAILDTIDDGLLIFDKENKLLLVNKAAKKFFGVKNDILGKKSSELISHPTLKFLFYLLTEKIKETFRQELKIREDLILEVSCFSILENKKEFGKLIVLHDITREKRIEKLKTDFVSISAHQLRTPLTSLRWSLEVLSRFSQNLLPIQKTTIEKAKDSVEKMLRLINELLDIVRIEEGRYIIKLKRVDFEEILNKVIKEHQAEIKQKGLKFELKLPSKKIPKIKADPERLYSVIENFLDNAIRYNFPGGSIEISVDFDKKELKFSVKDTGIGIPENEKDKIFTKFYRASNAIRMKTEGSGVGLFISKNIIKAHNGKIWFESEENKGSKFYFTLPIK